MGCLVWENMTNSDITLKRWPYLLGNLAPDLAYSFTFKLHSYVQCGERFRKLLRKLFVCENGNNSVWLSFCSGVLSHYICDFFCYAHTDVFKGKVREHIKYEKSQVVRAEEMLCFNTTRYKNCNYSELIKVIEDYLTMHSHMLTTKVKMSEYDIPLAVYVATWALSMIHRNSVKMNEIGSLRSPLLSA